MVKPLWQELHEGFLDDIKIARLDIYAYEQWLIESPGNNEFIETLDYCKKKLKQLRKEYKQRYGQFPKPSQLK